MNHYLIRSKQDADLFWHEERGWVSRGEATQIARKDRPLPPGGEWTYRIHDTLGSSCLWSLDEPRGGEICVWCFGPSP
jgi:hypothetical protein